MSNNVESTGILGQLFDPLKSTASNAPEAYRWSPTSQTWMTPVLIGVAALIMTGVGFAIDHKQFYFSFLVGWLFAVSISVGALFFLIIGHLTRASWNIVLRRIAEATAVAMPLLALMGIPIVFLGMHDLYHWTHLELFDPTHSAYDPVIAGKQGYLNAPFFMIRVVVYFLAWSWLARALYRQSILQDGGNGDARAKMVKLSAIGLPIMAVTVSFAAFDLLMSLDPHWFSTIFGVYFFAGAFWTVHAFIAFIANYLHSKGHLKGVVTSEHMHDVGKFMFGFTVFWAYIAFSQYMLIWYGNLPEETVWFRHRLEEGWEIHSAVLLIMHFVVPFFILIPRFSKRMGSVMSFMAVYFFVMQWFDLHWLSMPVLHHHAMIHWMDVTAFIGFAALFLGMVLYRLSRHSLVPHQDPQFAASVGHINL